MLSVVQHFLGSEIGYLGTGCRATSSISLLVLDALQ